MGRFTGILGLLSMGGLAFAFSTDRRAIKLKIVLWGVGLQLTFAFLVLKFEVGRAIFACLGAKVKQLLNFSYVGSEFIFGELGKKNSSFGGCSPSRFCQPLYLSRRCSLCFITSALCKLLFVRRFG